MTANMLSTAPIAMPTKARTASVPVPLHRGGSSKVSTHHLWWAATREGLSVASSSPHLSQRETHSPRSAELFFLPLARPVHLMQLFSQNYDICNMEYI